MRCFPRMGERSKCDLCVKWVDAEVVVEAEVVFVGGCGGEGGCRSEGGCIVFFG